jgi:hypothetical protein
MKRYVNMYLWCFTQSRPQIHDRGRGTREKHINLLNASFTFPEGEPSGMKLKRSKKVCSFNAKFDKEVNSFTQI